MAPVVIVATRLGKLFHLGRQRRRHATLRDAVAQTFRRLGSPRRLRAPREELWALRDVSFEIGQGSVVGLIGRNGAGKTTLLKILSRITAPTEGEARINGRVSSLLEVGTGFHPELTGRENIFLSGAILGMSRREVQCKFDEIVAFSEIERFIDTPVKHYSSGMYVRLAFAVAAHVEPDVLLVDEVLAVGDAAFQKKCLGKVSEVSQNGRTVIFVSHNLASIASLCTSAFWLEGGRLRGTGPTAEVIAAYEREVLDLARGGAHAGLPVEASGIALTSLSCRLDGRDLLVSLGGHTDQLIGRMGFGIRLSTPGGVTVSVLGSKVTKSLVEDVKGDWSCSFRIGDITDRLAGGTYVVDAFIVRPQIGRVLEVTDALAFELPSADAYGVGVAVNADKHGLVILPVRFEFARRQHELALQSGSRDQT